MTSVRRAPLGAVVLMLITAAAFAAEPARDDGATVGASAKVKPDLSVCRQRF